MGAYYTRKRRDRMMLKTGECVVGVMIGEVSYGFFTLMNILVILGLLVMPKCDISHFNE